MTIWVGGETNLDRGRWVILYSDVYITTPSAIDSNQDVCQGPRALISYNHFACLSTEDHWKMEEAYLHLTWTCSHREEELSCRPVATDDHSFAPRQPHRA